MTMTMTTPVQHPDGDGRLHLDRPVVRVHIQDVGQVNLDTVHLVLVGLGLLGDAHPLGTSSAHLSTVPSLPPVSHLFL